MFLGCICTSYISPSLLLNFSRNQTVILMGYDKPTRLLARIKCRIMNEHQKETSEETRNDVIGCIGTKKRTNG